MEPRVLYQVHVCREGLGKERRVHVHVPYSLAFFVCCRDSTKAHLDVGFIMRSEVWFHNSLETNIACRVLAWNLPSKTYTCIFRSLELVRWS